MKLNRVNLEKHYARTDYIDACVIHVNMFSVICCFLHIHIYIALGLMLDAS